MQTPWRALCIIFKHSYSLSFSRFFPTCSFFLFFDRLHLPYSRTLSSTSFPFPSFPGLKCNFSLTLFLKLHFLSAPTTQHLAPTVSSTKSFSYLLLHFLPSHILLQPFPFSLLLHTHLTQKLKQKFTQITESIPSLHHQPRVPRPLQHLSITRDKT